MGRLATRSRQGFRQRAESLSCLICICLLNLCLYHVGFILIAPQPAGPVQLLSRIGCSPWQLPWPSDLRPFAGLVILHAPQSSGSSSSSFCLNPWFSNLCLAEKLSSWHDRLNGQPPAPPGPEGALCRGPRGSSPRQQPAAAAAAVAAARGWSCAIHCRWHGEESPGGRLPAEGPSGAGTREPAGAPALPALPPSCLSALRAAYCRRRRCRRQCNACAMPMPLLPPSFE